MESLVHDMLSNAVAVTVLAAAVAILGRACRRPALIHSLCLVAILKLITPPIVPVPLPSPWPCLQSAPAADAAPDPESIDLGPALPAETIAAESGDDRGAAPAGAPPVAEPDDGDGEWPVADPSPGDPSRAVMMPVAWKWEPLVLGLILAGAIGWWSLAAVRTVRFHRVLRDIRPVPEDWQAQAGELAGRLGLRRRPAVWLVPGEVPPMLWAIGRRPRLLVPLKLWSTLGEAERTALLLHELAHLKRRDHWVRWLELVVAGLYWWHPAVWWLRRALREAEEQCCDAWVVWAMPQDAKTYAAALLAAVEFVSGARSRPAAATAAAILGNGHVSCLKRRLRMIMRAKTPKRLSWAGRFAVMGLAALLLPLAPSWAQKDSTGSVPPSSGAVTEPQSARATDELLRADLQLLEAKADLEAAQKALARADSQQAKKHLETRIAEEFQKDPAVAALTDQIHETEGQLEDAKSKTRIRDSDPAITALHKHHRRLLDQYNKLWETRHDALLARLTADDEDDKVKGDKGREAAERIEAQLKELIDKLGKELGPVGEEVRKALERAVDEIHRSLRKEGMTAEDLRRALERSREELRRSFERGGPIEREMREALERARKDMQEALERSRQEMERAREEMRSRMEEMRKRQRERAEEARKRMEEARERQREHLEDALKGRARPKAEARPEAAEKEADRASRRELEAARREIRELEQRLRSANRRLEELQRRESRRAEGPRRGSTPPAGSARPRPPEPPRPPRPPAAPETPARPAEPRRARPPAPPRDSETGPRENYERRFRELEDKLNRLLRELEDMKREKAIRIGNPSYRQMGGNWG